MIFGAGFLLIVASSFSIDHFDLFGLRHVYYYCKDKEYVGVPFKIPLL